MEDQLVKRLVQGLKEAGINFITYLPETRLSQILPILRDDPDVELVPVASEAEAVTIAAGATLGGKQSAVYLENSGLYVSSYSLLTVGKQLGVPLLLITAFLGGFPDQRNSFLYATIGNRTVPLLEAWESTAGLLKTATGSRSKLKTQCGRQILCEDRWRCFSAENSLYDSI